MAIAVLLIIIAVPIAIEIEVLLIGQGVEPLSEKKMIEFLQSRPAIAEVYKLLTLQMGSDVMVAVKVPVQCEDDGRQMIDDINHCQTELKATFAQTR